MAKWQVARRAGWPARLAVAALLLVGVARAAAQGPVPPCGAPPVPPYPPPGAAPALGAWSVDQQREAWIPPACSGWPQGGIAQLVALVGRIDGTLGTDALLARFGDVSALRDVLFWAVSEKRWKPMFVRAAALTGPDAEQRRPDFTAAELKSGRALYFVQMENAAVGEVVYRLRVREATADRIVLETENVTSIRYLLFRVFGPGDLGTLYVLERRPEGGWGYYSLVRVGSNASGFAQRSYAPYANRMLAIYRHVAGIPTDQEPPAVR